MGESLIVRAGGGVDTSNATATNNQLVEGCSCYVNDELVVGNIPIKSPVNKTLHVSQLTNLESGYYVIPDVIPTSSLSEETVVTSTISDILVSGNGWVNGAFLNGTMSNNSGDGSVLQANASYTIPPGWYSGTEKITQFLSTQSGSSVTPGSVNKTVCNSNKWTTGNIIIVGDSKLAPGNIKNGVNIF